MIYIISLNIVYYIIHWYFTINYDLLILLILPCPIILNPPSPPKNKQINNENIIESIKMKVSKHFLKLRF